MVTYNKSFFIIIIQHYLSFTTMDIFALYLFESFGFVMYVEWKGWKCEYNIISLIIIGLVAKKVEGKRRKVKELNWSESYCLSCLVLYVCELKRRISLYIG